MNKETSLGLDLLRWTAAVCVFVTHFIQLGVAGPSKETIEPLGRAGVVVFFVLSGYVIDYVAHEKHFGFRDYLDARVARLYSVFIPALLLTMLADLAGRSLRPELYAGYPHSLSFRSLATLAAFLGFLYENSIVSLRWWSNGPMWSIAYEFWYYAIFGACFFFRGKQRLILAGASILLAGWKIMLLFPLWLAGVVIRRATLRPMSSTRRCLILVASLAMLGLLISPPAMQLLVWPLRRAGAHLPEGFHSFFLADYLTALPVMLVLVAVTAPGMRPWHPSLAGIVRSAAASTFSLYLYHVPLVLLSAAIGWYDPASALQCCVAGLVILVACHVLSLVTEAQKAVVLRWIRVAERRVFRLPPPGAAARTHDRRIST